MKFYLLVAACATYFLLGFTTVTEAALVEVNYSGTVVSVDTALSGAFTVNDPLSGAYTYDTTATDLLSGDPIVGAYAAITAGSGSVGSYNYSLAVGSNQIRILNNTTFESVFGDHYKMTHNIPTGTDVGDFFITSFSLLLTDTEATVFADDSLPDPPPSFADIDFATFIDSATFKMDFSDGLTTASISGTLGSHAVVPIPGAIWLFGSGLIGLAGMVRKPDRA